MSVSQPSTKLSPSNAVNCCRHSSMHSLVEAGSLLCFIIHVLMHHALLLTLLYRLSACIITQLQALLSCLTQSCYVLGCPV